MKQDAKEFIFKLLKEDAACKGVHTSGNNISCQCPYHRPKNNVSAFGVNFLKEEKGFPFQCYSCGQTGNIFQLIMHIYNCSYSRAEKIFLRKVAISPINLDFLKKIYYDLVKNADSFKKEKIIDLPNKFSSKPMKDYLRWRNESEQHNVMDIDYVIGIYKLFYCESGRYANRIIMPIRDIYGRTVYFTNRSIQHDAKAKNLFPQESDSLRFLYGLYESLGKKKAMLFEGPFEVFQTKSFAKKHNYNDWGFVAMMGTVMNEYRAGMLSEIFDEIYICLDNQDDVWIRDKNGKNKEDKVYDILADFMPTYRITKELYPGKEAATSNESQLKKLFEHKHEAGLNYILERWAK